MESFATYLSESTVNVENVKMGIVHYINDALLSMPTSGGGNIAATIRIGNHSIRNVVAAKPSNSSSSSGIIPYVDIELILANGSTIKIGVRAAKHKKYFLYRNSQLGKPAVPAFEYGINSLDKVFPKIREHFVSSLLKYYIDRGFSHGQVVPVVYGKISNEMKKVLLLGDRKYGGQLDYVIAVDSVPFIWRRMRIPQMSHGFTSSEFMIEINNSKAFDASEVMSNNDLYVWSGDEGRTLYLGDDKIDKTNLPAILGPQIGKSAPYGIRKFKVGLNMPNKMSFEIEDHTNLFRLELKSIAPTKDIMLLPAKAGNEDGDEGGFGGRSSGRRAEQERLNRSEFGSKLSPEEREELIDQIVTKTVRGTMHRFKKDVDRDQMEIIKNGLDSLPDSDLNRLSSLPSHRIAPEIWKLYL